MPLPPRALLRDIMRRLKNALTIDTHRDDAVALTDDLSKQAYTQVILAKVPATPTHFAVSASLLPSLHARARLLPPRM